MWKTILLTFLLVGIFHQASSNKYTKCPPQEAIPDCWCMEYSYLFRGAYVSCGGVVNEEDLQRRIKGLVGNPVDALQLYNSSLTSLPRSGIFQGMRIDYLWLDTSNFKSFAPVGTKGQSPLAGLEDSLRQIKLEGLQDLEFMDWSEFSGLKKLWRIEVARCNIETLDASFSKLPKSFQELYLFDGSVKSIEKGAFALDNLKSISIMYNNNIDRLDRSIFGSNPTNLTSIMFSLNKIREISDDFFQELPSLTFADIGRNRLTKLPASLKENWSQFESIYLAGNPYQCDCNLLWLLRAAKGTAPAPKYGDLDFITCGSPQKLQGKELTSLEETDLCPSNP